MFRYSAIGVMLGVVVMATAAVGCEYDSIEARVDAGRDGAPLGPSKTDGAMGDGGELPRVDSGKGKSTGGSDANVDDDAGEAPATPDHVVQIGSGMLHTCVRFESGRVKCWGVNDRGQLGYGDMTARGDAPDQMGDNLPYVNLGKGRKAVFLAVGRKVNCALLDDNDVKCWGYNETGQLGLGTWCLQDCTTAPVLDNRGDQPNEMGDNLPAVSLGSGRVMQLAVGGEIACVILDDESLRCWGRNSAGALGNPGGCTGLCDDDKRGDEPGEMGAAIPAIDVGTGLTVEKMSLGWDYVLALLSDGSVKAWGKNYDGELGLGDSNNRGDEPGEMGDNLKKVILPAGKTATQVYAGALHACARLDDGTLYCWASNGYGQLGVGDTVARCDIEGYVQCAALAEVSPGDSPYSVAPGNTHTCVIRKQGDLRCFGNNDEGQLGLGDTVWRGDTVGELAAQAPSAPLTGGHRYIAVTSGHSFSCALTDDARVRCWGINGGGQLGLGDPRSRGTWPPSADGSIDVDLGNP